MWIYLIVFLIPLIFFFVGDKKNRNNPTVLFVYFLCLALFVGVSDMLGGYDRYIYAELFDGLADDIREGKNPFLSTGFLFYGEEKGYGLLTIIIAFFTSNRYIFIFIVTLVIYATLIRCDDIALYTSNRLNGTLDKPIIRHKSMTRATYWGLNFLIGTK